MVLLTYCCAVLFWLRIWWIRRWCWWRCFDDDDDDDDGGVGGGDGGVCDGEWQYFYDGNVDNNSLNDDDILYFLMWYVPH